MTVSQAYNNVVKQMNTGAHYATDARNYYRTENNANNQIVKNETKSSDKKPIVLAMNQQQSKIELPESLYGSRPVTNALTFAANNQNYRQSSRPQAVQATNSVRTNEVNIQNVNVTTAKETAPGIWKDMRAAIKDNPLMQYNEAMS